MPLPQIYVEKTLALIKPDIVDKEEEIRDIILRSGFTIIQVTSGVSFISFHYTYINVATRLDP